MKEVFFLAPMKFMYIFIGYILDIRFQILFPEINYSFVRSVPQYNHRRFLYKPNESMNSKNNVSFK